MRRMTGTIQNNQSTTWLIEQLKNNPKQYPPLNKTQEQELIYQYKNDRDKLNELLYMHNIRLAFNMAKRYATKTNDFDSLVSNCLYGLAVACQRFDITKGIKFSTYATSWIFKYCLSGFYDKQNEIDKVSMSIHEPRMSSKNDGNEMTFENYLNDSIDQSCTNYKTIDQDLDQAEMTDICKDLLERLEEDISLSSTDKNVFIDHVIYKEKSKDIAEKYGIDQREVGSIKSRVLSKFKDILSSEYCINKFSELSS